MCRFIINVRPKIKVLQKVLNDFTTQAVITGPLTIWGVGLQSTGYVLAPVSPCMVEGGRHVRVPHSAPAVRPLERLWLKPYQAGIVFTPGSPSLTFTLYPTRLNVLHTWFVFLLVSALCSSWLCSFSGLMQSKSSLKLCRHPTACVCVCTVKGISTWLTECIPTSLKSPIMPFSLENI